MAFSDVTSITTETIVIGPSAVAGITALSSQIGIQLGLRGGTTTAWAGYVGGTYPAAASFFATCVNLNYLHQNLFPIRGQFFMGGNAGATVSVDVTRFFKN